MTEPITYDRRHWRFSLWSLMFAPVVCALLFAGFSWLNRIPPLDRHARERRWCARPSSEFWPKHGAPVVKGDDLVKMARVAGPWENGRDYGQSSWVTPDGVIHEEWLNSWDGGGNATLLSPRDLVRLLSLLWDLPPSDPGAMSGNRVHVAFPVKGLWVVRTYRRDSVPSEVDELSKALGLDSSWLYYFDATAEPNVVSGHN